MNLGLFIMPMHPPEKLPADSYAEDLELLSVADELGFTEAWVGEHMTAKWENIVAPDLFISRGFGVTKKMRLGTGVYLLSIRHPADVASSAAFLDHLSRGRFNFGVGVGSVPTDRPFMGVPPDMEEMIGRFRESLDIILKIWEAEPPWKFEGKYWTVELVDQWKDIHMGYPLRPFTKPHPPIGIPGFSPDSRSIFEAGKRGWWPLSTNLTTERVIGTHHAQYLEGLKAGGFPVSPDGWRVAREVFVADTDREALDYAINGPMGQAFTRYMLPLLTRNLPSGLLTFKDDPDMPDSDVTVEYLANNIWIVGSPETVTEKLDKLRDEQGKFGTLLVVAHDWADRPRAINSLELLANKVRPALAD